MTIYDIAEKANVSASTISRVINNKPGVSEKKRREIQKLLDELHYEPDENAQNLVKQKSNMIGILTDDLNSRHQNMGTARIQNAILSSGFNCFIKYIGREDDAVRNSIIDMARKRVEGVLVLGVSFHDHRPLKKAISRYLPDTPIVLVHQVKTIDLPNVYAVGADEKKGIQHCVEKLLEKNRKNLLLMVDENRTSEEEIKESFKQAVKRAPGINYKICTDVKATREGGETALKELYPEYPEMDGLLCVNDSIAIGAMYALQDLGKRIPEDVSIIGEDNSESCDACRPKLTSMDPMLAVDTVMSANILVDVLSGVSRNRSVVLEMEIVERETL